MLGGCYGTLFSFSPTNWSASYFSCPILPAQIDLSRGEVTGMTTSPTSATTLINKLLSVIFARTLPERFWLIVAADQAKVVLNAKSLNPSCIQQFESPGLEWELFKYNLEDPPSAESKGYLKLNVYLLSRQPLRRGRAVLFWMFGTVFKVRHYGLTETHLT